MLWDEKLVMSVAKKFKSEKTPLARGFLFSLAGTVTPP